MKRDFTDLTKEPFDLIIGKLGKQAPCATAHTPLPGAPAVNKDDIEKSAQENGLQAETVAHLASLYGSRYTSVLKYAQEDKRLANPISSGGGDILAQIKHAVREEQALSVSDFVLRRNFIGLRPDQGLDAIDTIASEMSALLGWNAAETQIQKENYRTAAASGQLYRS